MSTTAATDSGARGPDAPARPDTLGSFFTAPPLDRLTTDVEDFDVAEGRLETSAGQADIALPTVHQRRGAGPNGMPWIELQLQALSSQEVPRDWEVVVADNGSRTVLVPAWSDGPNVSSRFRLVDASTRPGPVPLATSASVRPVAGRWPSATPTTWCVPVGSPRWWPRSPTPTWSPACSTSVALNGRPASDPIPVATRQLGFLPFGLGANLAVRREAFEAAQGFCETLSAGEDIDLSWRLQLAGCRFAVSRDAAVAKRERADGLSTFRATWTYGQSGPLLFRHYHARACNATFGVRQDLGLVAGRQPRFGRVTLSDAMRRLRSFGVTPDV